MWKKTRKSKEISAELRHSAFQESRNGEFLELRESSRIPTISSSYLMVFSAQNLRVLYGTAIDAIDVFQESDIRANKDVFIPLFIAINRCTTANLCALDQLT